MDNKNTDFVIKHDSMGELRVPKTALYGAQTQRAVNNFQISGLLMPKEFIKTLGSIKAAAAMANADLKLLDDTKASLIISAAKEIVDGQHSEHFPIEVFQTGSGTSSNMNANEVIASLANIKNKAEVHPNDDVNMSQSSNDTIPTAISVSAAINIKNKLLPALSHLIETIKNKAKESCDIVKTGRTHLMDAMPIRLDQELNTWAKQIFSCAQRIESTLARLCTLSQGGTAIGTGTNAHPKFAEYFCKNLTTLTTIDFKPNDCLFEGIAAQDTIVELSGQLKVLAVALMKISNDLRWMNSGPLAGLGEIALPALQPGSSIMPGKVNPVIPEAVCMVAAKVIGNDSTITIAGQSGNFQLNVMLPVVAYCLLESIEILSNSVRSLADNAISGFKINTQHIATAVDKNPIMVTALNPVIGYELGAKIAKTAYQQNRSVKDITREMTDLSEADTNRLLDPKMLTEGGIVK